MQDATRTAAVMPARRGWRTALGTASLSAALAVAPSGQQPSVFQSVTTAVVTDVIPRDGRGRFIDDLTAADFLISEDGAPQAVQSFAMVRGGRTLPSQTAAPAPVEGIVVPQRPPGASGSAGRVFLVIVDDLHFEAEYTPHVRRIIQSLATTLLHDGDQVAMVSTGPSALEIPLTRDFRMVAESASRVRGSGLTAAEIFQLPETSQGVADLRRRAQMAFQTAYRMVGALDTIRDRRKVVVYLSSGYDLDPYAAGRQSADRVQGGRASDPMRFMVEQNNPYQRLPTVTADLDLLAYMRELALTANRANATLYTVDPRGLTGVTDAGKYVDQSEWRTVLQKTQSSLRYLSEQTGGRAIVNLNDFGAEFKRIDAETSDYYLLGYSSTNADATRRVRQIDVKVRRPGVTVVARSSYSLKSPPAGTAR